MGLVLLLGGGGEKKGEGGRYRERQGKWVNDSVRGRNRLGFIYLLFNKILVYYYLKKILLIFIYTSAQK